MLHRSISSPNAAAQQKSSLQDNASVPADYRGAFPTLRPRGVTEV